MIGIAEDGLRRGVEELANAAHGGAPEISSKFRFVFQQMCDRCKNNLVHRKIKGSIDSRRDSGSLNSEPAEPMPICGSLKVAPHCIAGPRRICGYPSDVVPIRWVRINGNHRMVCGAAPNGARAWIKYASIRAFGVPRGNVGICEMLDEIVPTQFRILGRERMKAGDLVMGVGARV